MRVAPEVGQAHGLALDLGEPVEGSVFDPSNVHVLAPHLAAAAAELPVTEADERWFGSRMRGVLDDLVGRGVLRWRPTGWYWTRQDRAVDHVSLRGIGQVVSVVERRTGRVVGTVDGASAVAQVHAGAVHVHQGVTYVVTDLDLEDATAHVVRGDPGWTTHARAESAFDVVAEEHGATHGPVRVSRSSSRLRQLKRGGQRVASIVMYLNTPLRGGATTFPDARFEVAAIKGNAVFFSYDRPHPMTATLHGGAPVVEGEKWVATKWLRAHRFD